MEVIRLSSLGVSQRSLAEQFKCGKTQIQSTLANKERFLSEWSGNVNRHYKRRREQPNKEINNLVWQWYQWSREHNLPVNGPLLQEKAREFAAAFQITTFSASNGWLESFRKRHGIDFKNPYNASTVAVEENLGEYRSMKAETLEPASSSPMMPIPGPSSAPSVSADNFLQSLDLYQSSLQQQKSRRTMRQEWTVPQQGPVGGQKPSAVAAPPLPQPQQPTMKKPQPQTVQAPKPQVPKPPPPRPVSPPQPPPPPPEVCLRWNSYHSNMQATFPSLLNNEQFVDVTLACEGRSIKCHKMMLSACSAYFEELLSQNPCQHPIVLMKDLRYWEVQALVDFMYRGEVNVGQDKLPSLLAAAEALQIKGLAGPASTSSSHDEDSLPPTLPLGSTEDYMDESTPSPSSARRARKRRVMASMPVAQPPPQPVPVNVPRNPVGRPRLSRASVPLPSTSSYHHESSSSLPSEPPLRRPRKSEPNDFVGEIKIEPIDIDISNDSMDHVDDGYMDKSYDDAGAAGDGGESSGQGDDGGGSGEGSSNLLGDHKTIIHGQDSDQVDYGNNNGMASDSANTPSTTGNDTELQGYRYEGSGNRETDIPGAAYPEVVMNPPGSSGTGNSGGENIPDTILGHM